MPKIYLSPSFQQQNVGVGDYGTEEKRCNEIADVVERELKKNNNFVIVRNNPNMSLNEVIADSNKSNADIHFSIHTNAGSSSARGCEVYAYAKNTEGDKLAQIVYRRLSAITPSEDRGVKYNSLAETRQTKAIAVLTEVAFHSNEEDAKWMINNVESIGKELAKSLYEYYNIEYKENETSELKYKVHIQDVGWSDWKELGEVAGTTGEAKRIEAIILEGNNELDLSYRVHMENKGWSDWVSKGEIAGTTGESRRIEAIEIKSNKALEVQEHIENVGWMPSSKGTNIRIGTEGKSLRLEAFKIKVL